MVSLLDFIIPSLLRKRYLFTCSPKSCGHFGLWPFWMYPITAPLGQITSLCVLRSLTALLNAHVKISSKWRAIFRQTSEKRASWQQKIDLTLKSPGLRTQNLVTYYVEWDTKLYALSRRTLNVAYKQTTMHGHFSCNDRSIRTQHPVYVKKVLT